MSARDGSEIDIGLLGPLQVRRRGKDVTPTAPKLRTVLAALVLNTGMLVSTDQLFDELWENRPPQSALTTLQTYIYQLRRRLSLDSDHTAPGGARSRPVLLTRVGGYELRLDDPAAVDVHRFERLVTLGNTELEQGRSEAAATLQSALDGWRGPALIDITRGRRLGTWVTQLEERRKAVQERRFGLLLDLGHHRAALDELAGAVRANPTHERFTLQLMMALHRSGRRPDALEAFRRVRSHLVADLGLEPSMELQRLHHAILTGDPRLLRGPGDETPAAMEPSRVVSVGDPPDRSPLTQISAAQMPPAQMPPAMPDFAGRERELARGEELIAACDRRGTVPVLEVHGPPGFGKSSFAVQLAHRVRSRFPDGQLFIDQSGVAAGEAQFTDILTATLRACGFARSELPATTDEMARELRSWTAERRVLIVVDDVTDPELLRSLLPGGTGCAVISTHRYRGDSMPGAHDITLPPLTKSEAVRLFGNIVGNWRVEDESEAFEELVRISGQLPLTVRGLARRLASRPGWSAARLVERLRFDELSVLELASGPNGLINAIAVSYRSLPAAHRRVLRSLVVQRVERITVQRLTSLMDGGDLREAALIVDQLVDAHLLEEVPQDPGRTEASGPAELAYSIPRLTFLALLSIIRCEEDPDVVNTASYSGRRKWFQRIAQPSSNLYSA